MERIYCMLIGDVINSQKMETEIRSKIQVQLKHALEKINFDYDKYICSRFCITLGDEFQGGLYSVYPLFDILDMLKESIAPYKIRFGIGIDTMATQIEYNLSLGSDGAAYYAARKAVENLKRITTYEYGYEFGGSVIDTRQINDMMRLVDCISQNWTDSQKEYITKLRNNKKMDYSGIAKIMKVNISSVSRAVSNSNYKLIQRTMDNLRDRLFDDVFISDIQDRFWSQYNKSCQLIDQGNLEEATKLLTPPISSDDLKDYYSLLAIIHNMYNDIKNAIKYAKTALENMSNDFRCKKVRMLNILGICYTNLEQYEQAEAYFKEALNLIYVETNIDSWKSYTLGNLGRLYFMKGDYVLSEKVFFEVKAIIDKNFYLDHKMKLALLSSLGSLYDRWGRYNDAMNMYNEALQTANTLCEKNISTFILKFNFAKFLIRNHSENRMEIFYLLKDAADGFKKAKLRQELYKCYDLLCSLCNEMGEHIKADEYRELIERMEETIDD